MPQTWNKVESTRASWVKKWLETGKDFSKTRNRSFHAGARGDTLYSPGFSDILKPMTGDIVMRADFKSKVAFLSLPLKNPKYSCSQRFAMWVRVAHEAAKRAGYRVVRCLYAPDGDLKEANILQLSLAVQAQGYLQLANAKGSAYSGRDAYRLVGLLGGDIDGLMHMEDSQNYSEYYWHNPEKQQRFVAETLKNLDPLKAAMDCMKSLRDAGLLLQCEIDEHRVRKMGSLLAIQGNKKVGALNEGC